MEKINGDVHAALISKGNLVAEFWDLATKLCFVHPDHPLECQTIRVLCQLLSNPSYHVCAWDALRRTQLLSVVVVHALGCRDRLKTLASSDGGLDDYMRVVELASEANPYECMLRMSPTGNMEVERNDHHSGLYTFLPLLARLSLLDNGAWGGYRRCIGSFVRTVSFLLSDARNCNLLVRVNSSPVQVLLDSLIRIPADRHDARLVVLRGILQFLLHTANLTKVWVEHFSLFNGPAVCFSVVIEWCSIYDNESSLLNSECTVMFDILCLLLALPDSGTSPNRSLYLYLRAANWEADDPDPDPSVYAGVIGMFGLRLTVQASLIAIERRPTLFLYLARLLIRAVCISSADVIGEGLVSDLLVRVLKEYVHRSTEMVNQNLGCIIAAVVRLCAMVCASLATYARQKDGATQLCILLVQLASSPIPEVLRYTIHTITFICGFFNEELFFTYLTSVQLFEELDKRLRESSEPGEIQLVLQFLNDVCTRVPSLQQKFLFTLSDTVVSLMRIGVKNGPRLLAGCTDLLTLVLVSSGKDALRIQTGLHDIVIQTDFQLSKSVISGCWGLQTCIRAVKGSADARRYFAVSIDSILACLEEICAHMKLLFSSELVDLDLCDSFEKIWAYHRHNRDANEAVSPPRRYLLLCDFLILLLHLLCLIQANSPDLSSEIISCKLQHIISKGPFLWCRLYTSIIARAFVGMCSLSSLVVFEDIPTTNLHVLPEKPVTRQSIRSGWSLQPSYGDELFASGKQRIVYTGYLRSFQKAICQESKVAPYAFLGSSIIELFLDMFFNCLENTYIFVEMNTVASLAELFALAVAECPLHMQKCFGRLVSVTRYLGKFGVSHTALLNLLRFCLRNHDVDSVVYDGAAAGAVFSAWKTILRDSIPSSQPMLIFGISAGFPTLTQGHSTHVNRVKKELGLFGGVNIPMQLTVPKSESCLSAALWFLLEPNSPPLSPEDSEFTLLLLCFDQNKTSVMLNLSESGTFNLGVAVRGNQQVRSKNVPVPIIKVPTQQWCMISISLAGSYSSVTPFRSKLRLDVRLGLHTMNFGSAYSSVEVSVGVEMSLGALKNTDHLFREVNMVSIAMSRVPTGGYPQQLLFGSLGVFAASLSKLEVESLFAMGSDNLSSLSFMDRSFILSLYPTLANMLQRGNYKEEKGEKKCILTDEMVLLSALWLRHGTHLQGADDRIWFSGASFPFSRYHSRERLLVIAALSNDELRIKDNAERRGPSLEASEKQDFDATLTNSTPERPAKTRLVTPISLTLSADESDVPGMGSVWAAVNGPRFRSISPAYSILDAVGGIPFFLWLVSLQGPSSYGFEEAWMCVCTIIQWHSADSLLCSAPSHGGRYIANLLRVILHNRIGVSKKTAVSLLGVIGHRMIIRIDLLPLILDFTLWSQDVHAFRLILCKLQQYAMDDHYGQFNTQILRRGIRSRYNVDECYALEEFLMHLLMYFSGESNGNWDASLISCANAFVFSFCRTEADFRRVIQTINCLLICEETPGLGTVEWVLGLLDVVRSSIEFSNPSGVGDEQLAFDVIRLLRSPNERVRSKALSLLAWVRITKMHFDAMVDGYLARKVVFPDLPCLSMGELGIIVDVINRRTASGDTPWARMLLNFPAALLIHVPYEAQMRYLLLLRDVLEEKGLLIRDLVFPDMSEDHAVTSIESYLFGALPILMNDRAAVTMSVVELLIRIGEYMVEISYSANDGSCGFLLCETMLAIFLNGSTLKDIEQKRQVDSNARAALTYAFRFSASCLRIFTLLASRSSCSVLFFSDYILFLRTTASVVFLSSWCEGDRKVFDETHAEIDAWAGEVLLNMYVSNFGKQPSFCECHTGVRLAILLLECARRLTFELQRRETSVLPIKWLNKACEDLLLLQWRVITLLLYDAEKDDDDVVRELSLLHLAHSGSTEYGYNYYTWEKQTSLVQPPIGSNWRYLQLSPNTLLIELLKRVRAEVLKESAPWIILLRAASSLLHMSPQGNPFRRSIVFSICRLVRYNTNIWSLAKGGVSPSSVTELDATLRTDLSLARGTDDGETSKDEDNNSFSPGNPLWGIELSRNGVASLEKYVVTVHSSTFSLLRRFGLQITPSPPVGDLKGVIQPRTEFNTDVDRFHELVRKRVYLFKKCLEEDGSAILAAHAAYRFSLLPWWGQCINLYSKAPAPLNRWELDRFMGIEWQRVRLRRFVHNERITKDGSTDQFLQAVHREGVFSSDDMKLLEFYSVTAVPQLLNSSSVGTDSSALKCKLVLPMERVPVILYVSSQNISYVLECRQRDSAQLGDELSTSSFSPHGADASNFLEAHNLTSRVSGACKYKHDASCLRRVVDIPSIRAVWPRRNLLQPCALELLLFTGETLFLAFDSEEIKKRVLDAIVALARPYMDKTLLMTEGNLKMWRNWWCEGRITNFHYLMYLNFSAGRSYGDLRQYPVFPHVVADFVSEKLDFSSPAFFRCFSKPMGAQSADRAQRAVEKYTEIAAQAEISGDVPIDLMPHHYGSHYSPLGGALHYLVRVQPFSDYFMDMNSELDDAGRVFESMTSAYTISTGKDVKELLPELYCLPDVFVNSNRIPFGMKQDGEVVNDVQLPPWASTPRELTRVLRQALESRYTSENLHSWIDLIFGYKQRGKEAVTAVNVFHPLTYEGSVDLSTITDPVIRSSHETQIDYFGQIPLQLFTQPHKPRGKSTDTPFIQNPCPTLRYEASNSKSCILLHPEQLVPANSYKAEGMVAVFPRSRPATAASGAEEGSEWKFLPTQVRPIALLKGYLPFTVVNQQLRDCLCSHGNCILLVDGRDLSREICRFNVSCGGRITAVATEPPIVYVGMESGAIHILRITHEEWSEMELPRQNQGGEWIGVTYTLGKLLEEDTKAMRVRGVVRRHVFVFHGHTAAVTAVCLSSEWGILVSSAKDNVVAVWDTGRNVLIRTIPYLGLSSKYPKSILEENMWCQRFAGDEFWHYDRIAVNTKEGDIILGGYSEGKLHAVQLYSINGSFLASFFLGDDPATAILSVGGVVFVAVGTTVRVLREEKLEWICDITHPGIEDTIESLALNPNGTTLAACDRKSNLVTWRLTL